MVYCIDCGTENKEGASVCVSCGTSLKPSRSRRGWEKELETRAEEFGESAERFGKRMEEECFGLPFGRTIVGIIVGVFIILIGVSIALGYHLERWAGPFVLIIIGVLIIAGVLYSRIQRSS